MSLVRTRLDSNQTGSIRNAQRMRGMGADPLGEGGSQPRVQKCRIAAGNESGQFCTLKNLPVPCGEKHHESVFVKSFQNRMVLTPSLAALRLFYLLSPVSAPYVSRRTSA